VIKTKMKKQVVAILIAVAVISCLFTVSVLSEEAYKPIIQSVTVSPTEIVNGGVVTFTVTAKLSRRYMYQRRR
jgi:multisubunit Na+/H+ antiporter MnhB subunit